MNYVCIRSLSDKENIFNVFNKKLKTADKNGSVSRSTADCLNHYSGRDEKHKTKRLKSRRERSQMRVKEASKYKSHRHHCRSKISKDLAHVHHCCHSSCHCPSRRDVLFPNVVSAAQEPSIITDSRLTGHQGLFNHEVKSIAIERLLNKQGKLEKSGQQVQEKSNAPSRLSSTPPVASPLSVNDLLGADTDEVMPFEKKADPATKTHDDCQEEAKKISQGSDITPGQRPQQQLVLSSGSIPSSKHTSVDAAVIKTWKTNPGMSEKRREAQVTPTVDRKHVKTLNKRVKGNIISPLVHTPKNQEPPVHQPHGLNPIPLQLSSSHTADSFDVQYRRQDPNSVSKSVSTVAARLCDILQFPLLTRRSLVAESREVLLKALREWHGPQLQEDLLEVQRCLSFGTDHTKEVQNQEPTMVDEDELLHADEFPTVFQAITARPSRFDMEETTSLKITRNRQFNLKSSPQHNLHRTAEWLTSPVEPSVGLLDDILRPTRSPQLCMDFEPSGVTASNHLFAPSSTSCWAEEASASQHWGNIFNRLKSKEAVMFGSFENNYINHSRAVTERSRGSQYNNDNIQPYFSYQAQLPDRHAAQPVRFPQERGRFETDKYSFAPSFSAQSHYPQQHNNFQPFSQFSHPSSCPPLRSHHTDMMHYPPSHMLERDPAPPLSSFTSPEHWSFPPMRLY